eukprot:357798-Chlamydomonas_euryale.AAC.11
MQGRSLCCYLGWLVTHSHLYLYPSWLTPPWLPIASAAKPLCLRACTPLPQPRCRSSGSGAGAWLDRDSGASARRDSGGSGSGSSSAARVVNGNAASRCMEQPPVAAAAGRASPARRATLGKGAERSGEQVRRLKEGDGQLRWGSSPRLRGRSATGECVDAERRVLRMRPPRLRRACRGDAPWRLDRAMPPQAEQVYPGLPCRGQLNGVSYLSWAVVWVAFRTVTGRKPSQQQRRQQPASTPLRLYAKRCRIQPCSAVPLPKLSASTHLAASRTVVR